MISTQYQYSSLDVSSAGSIKHEAVANGFKQPLISSQEKQDDDDNDDEGEEFDGNDEESEDSHKSATSIVAAYTLITPSVKILVDGDDDDDESFVGPLHAKGMSPHTRSELHSIFIL